MPRSLTVVPVPGRGAEDVLVDAGGWVLTGTDDGSVFRVRPDGGRIDLVGNTGGRPLGLELLPDGRVLVCDAARGLLALDPATGRVETLATQARGQRMLLVDNAAVHSSGDVYFSDSSRVHRLEHYERDIAEDTSTGRLLRLTTSGDVEVLVERLRFANGVALAADESFVAVAESGGRRVVRRWLTGPQTGQTDVLADDLPGYPDNLSLGTDGLLWVALASPPIPALERLARMPPPVRRLAGRAPRRLRPRAGRSARVLALDATGHVVHDLDLPSQDFHFVTGVREHEGRVWLGSLREPAIAWCEP